MSTKNTRAERQDIVEWPDVLDAPAEVLTPDEFKLAFRGLAAGVAVVTAIVDGKKAAMTATSVASLSATPPLFIFSASQLSSATEVIGQAETVVVHILDAQQIDLARLCATSGVDRFADTDSWRYLPTGEPCFHEARVWIRGRIVSRYTAGSSLVHVIEALSSNIELDHSARWEGEHQPLVYHNRTWHALGSASVVE
jgi:flavin reductase (DIM6/NTAB) family NADH-FMN oxidoreductase RutF